MPAFFVHGWHSFANLLIMNLHSHDPYWLMKSGMVTTYPSLQQDLKTDVVVIGAGISGALTADALSRMGLGVTVVDRRHAGIGSTAASTAFLQYEIDTPLHRLSAMVGEHHALRSYELCREAIYKLQDICRHVQPAVDFHIRPSLQYASYKSHVPKLYKEYRTRKQYGFKVRWLEPEDIDRLYGFTAPGAILSSDGAEADAYLLTHHLLAGCNRRGHGIYNNTEITDIRYHKRGATLITNNNIKIETRIVVIACGYESLRYIPHKIAEVHSTYALVSEPIAQQNFWHRNSLIWETANPYLYFRITDKNRILIGGKDDQFYNPGLRDNRIKQKAKLLQEAFNKKLPDIPVRPDFSWAGAFAVTKDGLPYIGRLLGMPHTYFALGFGGNGITFSVIASQIIADLVRGKKNAD
ncbi:MAG: NAD(P)/FAD-dependent oxidoreductase, partial [Flavipsychrobacter sp.]